MSMILWFLMQFFAVWIYDDFVILLSLIIIAVHQMGNDDSIIDMTKTNLAIVTDCVAMYLLIIDLAVIVIDDRIARQRLLMLPVSTFFSSIFHNRVSILSDFSRVKDFIRIS